MVITCEQLLLLLHWLLQWPDVIICTAKEEKSITGYDLGKPEKFFMPESLLEISGITFYKGRKDTIYAIQDEQGRVFRLPWDVKRQYNTKFGKQGDYEYLSIINEQVIVLKSNGN